MSAWYINQGGNTPTQDHSAAWSYSGFYVDHRHCTLSPVPGTPGLGPVERTRMIQAELHSTP